MEQDFSHIEIHALIKENNTLLKQNNVLLKKIHRNGVVGFWFRVTWYALLIGLPFALYFYVLEPYFTAMGSSYDVFSAGMQEIPGWKHFSETLEALKARKY